MIPIIGSHGGYRGTMALGLVCLVYHATCAFCKRNHSHKNDALGKTDGQMVGAARSARQNVVGGSCRAGTSAETELRLCDIAKGSLEELAGDYEAFLTECAEVPWKGDDSRSQACRLLHRQMETLGNRFREEGGFTERLSRARLETRDEQVAAQGAPVCPKCGKLMRKMIARKGRNAGGAFWSCTGYPDCKGTRNYV